MRLSRFDDEVKLPDPIPRKIGEPHPADEGYMRLAAAVIEQAAKDAMGYPKDYSVRRTADKETTELRKMNRKDQMEEVKRFFCDPNSTFKIFASSRVDGKAMYDQIMYNWKTYNNWHPPAPKIQEVEEELLDDYDEF